MWQEKGIKVFSNRPASQFERGPSGEFKQIKVNGGLTTGITQALGTIDGYRKPAWGGFPGITIENHQIATEAEGLGEAFRTATAGEPFDSLPVFLTDEEYSRYYTNYSNDRLWMIHHAFPEKSSHDWSLPSIDDPDWQAYDLVNKKFANQALNNHVEGDRYWIQDYHLIRMAHHMRESFPQDNVPEMSFFLHIPFPEFEDFRILPEDQQVALLEGYLAHTSIFFQTPEDVGNFIYTLKSVLGNDRFIFTDRQDGNLEIEFNQRSIIVGAKPIGIDADSFVQKALQMDSEVDSFTAEFLRQAKGRTVVASLARLDPSKGSEERLSALEEILRENPEMQGKICLMEVVSPSREGVKAYDELDDALKRGRDKINQTYSDEPILLYPKGIRNFAELVGFYRALDIAAITSIRDGRCLVIDEVAALSKPNAVSVLGKGAGATRDYEDMAITVDGGNVASVAFGIMKAYDMLLNDPETVMAWNGQMKAFVHAHNVKDWAHSIRRDGNL